MNLSVSLNHGHAYNLSTIESSSSRNFQHTKLSFCPNHPKYLFSFGFFNILLYQFFLQTFIHSFINFFSFCLSSSNITVISTFWVFFPYFFGFCLPSLNKLIFRYFNIDFFFTFLFYFFLFQNILCIHLNFFFVTFLCYLHSTVWIFLFLFLWFFRGNLYI